MSSKELVLVLDFDKTIAHTFSEARMTVIEAYEVSVFKVFGEKALSWYQQGGGLQNRAPLEVVDSLLGQGFAAVSTDPSVVTDCLVEAKINLLHKEIGRPLGGGVLWPRLTKGFPEFWREVRQDPTIFTVILSSGHRQFIHRVFEVNELDQPDLMVTDDDLRRLEEPLCKPDPRLWHFMLGKIKKCRVDSWSNIVYVGDDPVKDGGLVKDLPGVDFFLFAENSGDTGMRHFSNWCELGFMLT